MSYEKQTWQTGDVVTSAKLNHMEDGIAGGGALLVNINDEGTMDKTWQEIYDAMPGAWAFGMGEYMPIYVITSSSGYKLSTRVLSSNTKYDFVADTANSYPTFDNTPG